MDMLELRNGVLQRIERYRRSLVHASGADVFKFQAKLDEAEAELRSLFGQRMVTPSHWAAGSEQFQSAGHA